MDTPPQIMDPAPAEAEGKKLGLARVPTPKISQMIESEVK